MFIQSICLHWYYAVRFHSGGAQCSMASGKSASIWFGVEIIFLSRQSNFFFSSKLLCQGIYFSTLFHLRTRYRFVMFYLDFLLLLFSIILNSLTKTSKHSTCFSSFVSIVSTKSFFLQFDKKKHLLTTFSNLFIYLLYLYVCWLLLFYSIVLCLNSTEGHDQTFLNSISILFLSFADLVTCAVDHTN